MSDTWAATCAPGHHYVAGVKLRPLTYGHALLMERLGLVEILTPLEFHAFVGICSRSYKSAVNWLGWFMSPVGQWYYDRKPLPKEYNQALGEAMEYLLTSQKMPALLGKEDNQAGGAQYGAPTLQIMRTIALSKLNYSPSELFDAPLGQVMWDIICLNEINGGAKIIHGEISQGLEMLMKLHKEQNGVS